MKLPLGDFFLRSFFSDEWAVQAETREAKKK